MEEKKAMPDVLAWVEEHGGLDAVKKRLVPEGMEWLLEVWQELEVFSLNANHVEGGISCCDTRRPKGMCYPQPSQLTHTKPEIDTWERLEEDAEKDPCDYFGFDGEETCGKCPASGKNCEQTMALDLVRRARALAERERGE